MTYRLVIVEPAEIDLDSILRPPFAGGSCYRSVSYTARIFSGGTSGWNKCAGARI